MGERPMESGGLDPEIEKELEMMLSDESLDSMLLGGASPSTPKSESGAVGESSSEEASAFSVIDTRFEEVRVGQKAKGRVIVVGDDVILLEFGPKQQGTCPREQFGDAPPSPGESIEVSIQRYDRGEGILICNRVGAVQKAGWEALEEGMVVQAVCTGKNKGGLEMEVAGHRAFMPAGQVSMWHVENLEEMVGQSIPCEVMEFNRAQRNIVLSHRAVMERERAEARENLLKELQVGQVREGTVRKVMPFGAFVDLGGVDGLVHVSDLSYERVKEPGDVVRVGETVKVQVLKIDLESNRIGLGMKQLQDDPFTVTLASLKEGAVVSGRITKIADFGAFVELQPGVEGLIHVSELSHERVSRVNQVVKQDEIVEVQILSIDPETRRIGLSMKALAEKNAEETPRAEDSAMAKLRAKFGSDRELKGGLG